MVVSDWADFLVQSHTILLQRETRYNFL